MHYYCNNNFLWLVYLVCLFQYPRIHYWQANIIFLLKLDLCDSPTEWEQRWHSDYFNRHHYTGRHNIEQTTTSTVRQPNLSNQTKPKRVKKSLYKKIFFFMLLVCNKKIFDAKNKQELCKYTVSNWLNNWSEKKSSYAGKTNKNIEMQMNNLIKISWCERVLFCFFLLIFLGFQLDICGTEMPIKM